MNCHLRFFSLFLSSSVRPRISNITSSKALGGRGGDWVFVHKREISSKQSYDVQGSLLRLFCPKVLIEPGSKKLIPLSVTSTSRKVVLRKRYSADAACPINFLQSPSASNNRSSSPNAVSLFTTTTLINVSSSFI